jgi:hypothetical protein
LQSARLDTTIIVAFKVAAEHRDGSRQNSASFIPEPARLQYRQWNRIAPVQGTPGFAKEHRMGKMPAKRPLPGRSTDLNEQDYGRLCALNKQLQDAEQWIDRRSREMITAYSLAAAQSRHEEKLSEDVELVATILFLVREGHPTFLNERDNILARIDIPILPATKNKKNAAYLIPASDPVQYQSDWNPLLLTLYEGVLQRDIAKLLCIGALCIDVALIEQQLRCW